MEKTIEETIKTYVAGLRKAGKTNVTVYGPDMLQCLLKLTGEAAPADIESDGGTQDGE